VNDKGFWEVECQKCEKIFIIKIINPKESSLSPNYLVKKRIEGNSYASELCFAAEVIQYNFDLNRQALHFCYETLPLYNCVNNGNNLELAARLCLEKNIDKIKSEYSATVNYCLANRCPDYKFLAIHLKVPCACEKTHFATYYCDFQMTGNIQSGIDDYLLADVSNSDIESDLEGLFSKKDIMFFLEKLFIRWNLISDQIIIAVPFVGYQWLPKEDKLAVWNWLFSMLNHQKTVFITRHKTLSGYKSVLEDIEGLNHAFLAEYGLENKIVSADTKKNDFHAKFFIGLSKEKCEILSGSANLVSGPSLENITFKVHEREKCDAKYLRRLNVNIPDAAIGNRIWILIYHDGNDWTAVEKSSFTMQDAIKPI